MGRFTGKVVVVTGASSGIGKATAKRLASEGGSVACLDIADDANAATAKEVTGDGGQAVAITCNVADESSVRNAMAAVVSELGRPNVVCNIAGIGKFAHSDQLALDEWNRIMAVNLTGTFLVAQAALPHLLDGGGCIVNTASTAAIHGQPYSAAYCASKGGVVMLTKALAWEYIERGVRVNAVAPGGIDTPIMQSFGFPDDASRKLLFKMVSPLGFGQPEEIANVFAFVASDECRYMTGAVVTMDGGMTC